MTVANDNNRIILTIFDGKVFGGDCWALLTSVFSVVLLARSPELTFLPNIHRARYKVAGLLLKNFNVKIQWSEV